MDQAIAGGIVGLIGLALAVMEWHEGRRQRRRVRAELLEILAELERRRRRAAYVISAGLWSHERAGVLRQIREDRDLVGEALFRLDPELSGEDVHQVETGGSS